MVREKLIGEFRSRFGRPPVRLVEVPGRVNLIGEHIDYNGFSVLPISIPRTVVVALSPREDGTAVIANTDPAYPETSFGISTSIPRSPDGCWDNYVKAAAQSLAATCGPKIGGMDALFSGSIPNSAGLSSSSALVIAAALSLLAAGGTEMDRTRLAEIMALGEHYVGTQGGGMDQAIALFGREGHAVRIDFFPLRCSPVPFPGDCSVVVAHSLIRAGKTENALIYYNRRPAECRLAVAMINAVLRPDPPLSRLGDLRGTRLIGKDYPTPEAFVDDLFPTPACSLEQVCGVTGDTPEALTEKYLLTRDGIPMPVPEEGFLIRRRALHVLTEAERVLEACSLLERSDTVALGRLMNDSHRSCDEMYGISTPELNTLTSIMRRNGALGARLTGAGFGGCAIALVKDESIGKFMADVGDAYYREYLPGVHPEIGPVDIGQEILFAVKPSQGAVVSEC